MKSIGFRDTKRPLCNLRGVAIALLFLVFICWMKAGPVCGADTVHVNISARVKWNTRPPEAANCARAHSNYSWSEGALDYYITGTMIRDDANSPTVSKKGQFFRPALRYKAQSMVTKYSYHERKMSCANPPIEDNRSGGGDITQSTKLSINLLSSMAQPFLKNLTPAQKQFAAQMQQQSMTVPDYYEFAAGGPGMGLHGKRIPGVTIGLQIKLPPSGAMDGARTWSAEAKKEPPSFKMGIYDVRQASGNKSLTPPEGGKKNVTYTVRWYIGKQPVVPPNAPPKIEDKDCEEMRKDITWLEATVKVWEDRALRNEIRNKYGDTAFGKYQETVEKTMGEQFPNPSTGKPEETVSLMETDPHCTGNCGPGENNPTIDVAINGQSVHLYEYDSTGKEIAHDGAAEAAVREGWQSKHGGRAGASKFDGCLEHEKAHVSDFVNKGYPETLDEFAEYELNGLRKQLEKRYKDLADMGC